MLMHSSNMHTLMHAVMWQVADATMCTVIETARQSRGVHVAGLPFWMPVNPRTLDARWVCSCTIRFPGPDTPSSLCICPRKPDMQEGQSTIPCMPYTEYQTLDTPNIRYADCAATGRAYCTCNGLAKHQV